jgi:hypothetical protein
VNCPHCNHPESRVAETRPSADFDKRVRQCRNCAKTFTTLERVAVYAGRAAGYIESGQPELEEEPDPESAPLTVTTATTTPFHPVVVGDELNSMPMEVRQLLVEWWNNSRRSKHKSSAAWTRRAWLLTVTRVSLLPPWQQLALAAAGVEQGWQTLKPEYIKDVSPPAEAGLVPKSAAMQEAISSWKKIA